MIITDSNIIFLIISLFGIYVRFKFMEIFFDRTNINKKIEVLSYALYFIIIACLYLFVNIPLVMMTANIILFIGITYNYKSSFKKRIIAIILIYLILALLEVAVALSFGDIHFKVAESNPHFESVPGWVSLQIISYIVVLLLGRFKDIKNVGLIPTKHWFAMLIVPLSSIYIFALLTETRELDPILLIISIVLIFLMNIFAFSLYDSLSKMYKSKTEKVILEQQYTHFLMQFDILKKSLSDIKSLQHDMKKHTVTLDGFIRNDEKIRALSYLSEIGEILEDDDNNIASSGNLAIDSILNFKLREAKLNDIDISLNLNIPSDLILSDFDITVVLGNLIDNAINATQKLETNRRIKLELKYKKKLCLFI